MSIAETGAGGPSAPRLVVGVGASAGGLQAFKALLSALPDEGDMVFLVVQHLDPTQESFLVDLLAPVSDLRVVEAQDGDPLEPRTVYVCPPGHYLGSTGERVELRESVPVRGVRLPVDHLFRSIARAHGPRAVGIVLSGAGSDGSDGLVDVKAAGGLTIAQIPETCTQPGMPERAIERGAELVLAIGEIPEALVRFAALSPKALIEPPDGARSAGQPPIVATSLTPDEIETLATLLDAPGSCDVRGYKAGTIERRVHRRMMLGGFDAVDAYFRHLHESTNERRVLRRELLINVTEFFRDPEAFAALRELAIDPWVAAAAQGSTLRAWVPGCATGEEAYSIGMMFFESAAAHGKDLHLQILATDIEEEMVALGRAATYSPSVGAQLSESRVRTFMKELDDMRLQIASPLRDTVSFAVHDVVRDPPFSRMDLISCRNLLIYLRPETQQHVLRLLHFALNPAGMLFLGSSESTGPQRDLFGTVSKKWRLYRREGPSRAVPILRGTDRTVFTERTLRPLRAPPSAPRGTDRIMPKPEGAHDLARRVILKARVPPTILVGGDGGLLFSHGELRPYLRFPEGENPSFDIGNLVTPELATRTRAALYKCRREGQTVSALSSPESDSDRRVCITASPAPELGEGAVILTFEEAPGVARPSASHHDDSPAQDAIIEQLERELQATRDDLQNAVEELESSNEELRTSNEESMSMNEELQSANEELEATTEELRSLNEELTTVNAQLREKVEQLEEAHDDLQNFFGSTKIATLFLDERLTIKRFTPSAAELLGIATSDVGRFIGDIARELLQGGLVDDARFVLEHLSPQTRELKKPPGRWITRQVLPYRTEARRIEGVVVTFVDVTDLKTATERLTFRERQQAVIARLGLQALGEPDLDAFFDHAVREVQQTLDTDYCKVLELQPGGESLLLRAGVGWQEGLVGAAAVSASLDSQAGYTLEASEPVIVDELASEKRFHGPALLFDHGVVSGLSCVIRHGETAYGVIGAHTARRRAFSREDANFLQAAAAVLGSAVSQHLNRVRRAVEGGSALAVAEAKTVDEVAEGVLACFEREVGAVVGELWWPDEPEGGALTCRVLRVGEGLDRDLVAGNFSRGPHRIGECLVGKVFAERRAAWLSVDADRSFVRAESAKALGIRTGLAFPVAWGGKSRGVFAVFARHRVIADEAFLRSLEWLGRTIGDSLARSTAEEQVRHLAAITESSLDAILSTDLKGVITQWLPGAEQLFGFAAAEMIGTALDRFVPQEKRDEVAGVHGRIRRGERVEPYETVRLHKDGRLLHVQIRSSPIRGSDGGIVGVSSTDRDISRQKEIERKLLEADRQKDDFLAMLGHELRNPLAAVRSATELLRLTAPKDPALEQTQAILARQTAHMAKLLDGLLDVSRIIRGKIAIEREVVDLVAVARDVVADVKARLEPRRLQLAVELPAGQLNVEGDKVRLAQIVDNLLSNAVKYTPDGGSITLTLAPTDGQALLRVRDTGVGIEPELLPYIFDVFRQAKQTLDRSHGGLGLGLALVKSLVGLHGGTVEARSEGPGFGAELLVRLPLTDAVVPDVKDGERVAASLRILVVEDNEDAAEMLRQVLEVLGHHASVATRGRQGVERAKAEHPDVILCDLGLPEGMTGFDVAKALKADPSTEAIRLVALTGYGRPEDKARCAEVGFDAHLTKPVEVATVERVLADVTATAIVTAAAT